MAKGDALPVGDEATRWVKRKFVGRDDNDQVIVDGNGRPTTVAPAAFELRDDEDALSVTWLQHFGPARAEHLPLAAEAVRVTQDSQKLSPQSAFVVGQVSAVISAGQDAGSKLRILHDPIDGNEGHTEIRRFPRDVGLLQTTLASEVFAERHLYDDVRKDGWQPE
ncbi:hypothetical protein [Sphingomonas sp.]|uniref:hypothetical protein n=1 Tax=Sphingomonas sp. TaxID=28214 RepID=UPI0025FE02B8|nr:hypothetical protein [Sphingomonas sp.]